MKNESLVVIYGAGNYGQKLLRMLREMKFSIDYFVQSSVDKQKKIEGVKLISWDELLHRENVNIFVLYAIKNKNVLESIKNSILTEEKSNIRLCDCVEIIENDLRINRFICFQGNKECLICKNQFAEYLPFGKNTDVFSDHHIIGGGYRNSCICPVCNSMDRQRWLYYLLLNKLNISSMKGRMLHFAPEFLISELIKQNSNIEYYTGDITKGRAMFVTDITNIQYADNSMDYIICNHVLEHIADIDRAMSEIKRVLKKDGLFIFSFPICMDSLTIEDSAISTPEDRLKIYGQEDHVRLYGIDYKAIYSGYGFELKTYSPKDMLTKQEIEKYGLIEDDIIIVGKKKL